MGKQMVPYGQLLDNFGKSIQMEIGLIKPNGLKPTIMADVMKVYGAVYGLQQLLVLLHNFSAQDYEKITEKINEQEKKIEALETRCAAFIERIAVLESKEKDLGGSVIRIILDNIRCNGSVRAKIQEIAAANIPQK
jgi:cell division protein FtsB